MIQRTSREHVLNILKKNQNKWKILDIGCNLSAVEYAQTVADIQDFSKFYEKKNKKFVLIQNKSLPFNDNQFDFVFASHVIEHIADLSFFLSELQRISKKGYIEVPSILEDNIVFSKNSSEDHKWIFKFDDVEKVLLVEKKKEFIEPFITHGILFGYLRKNFRSSLVLELYWKDEINFKFTDFIVPIKKPFFMTIIKKYISYYIRKKKLLSGLLLLIFLIFMFSFLF